MTDDNEPDEDAALAVKYACTPETGGCCPSCCDDFDAGFGNDLAPYCCCRAFGRADAAQSGVSR